MSYRLTEEDLEFWATRYAQTSAEIEYLHREAIKTLGDYVLQLPETDTESEAETLFVTTLSQLLAIGGVLHTKIPHQQQIEQSVAGTRGSRTRKAELERVKRRAKVLDVIAKSRKKS
jgi:hypothetical protein